MRKIDWEQELSDEDILWLRNSGQLGMEERIAAHQKQFGADVPPLETEDDVLTASALDASARASTPVDNDGSSGPVLVDPTQADPQSEEDEVEAEDYDSWKVAELQAEIKARNEMDNTSDVQVIPTGQDGKTLKVDLVKGLRLWDQENPDAFKD